jgi:pantoate--beta-alanine ligase
MSRAWTRTAPSAKTMQIHSLIPELRAEVASLPIPERLALNRGRIAIVPTMGNLHAGHIALMTEARAHGDTVVASIFVNRLQFGPNDDFDRYPRTFQADCEKLAAAGVDLLFAPDREPISTPSRSSTMSTRRRFSINSTASSARPLPWCRHRRPQAVQHRPTAGGVVRQEGLPATDGLAQHDAQLALPIEIVGGETVRADDGLALSSRNAYLSAAERAEAPRLQRLLKHIANGNLRRTGISSASNAKPLANSTATAGKRTMLQCGVSPTCRCRKPPKNRRWWSSRRAAWASRD